MKIQKPSRFIHRYLSFFFAGMIIIYAMSGIVMNHRDSINPYYNVVQKEFSVKNKDEFKKDNITEAIVTEMLTTVGEEDNYTHHYFPKPNVVKIFLKGGSSAFVNTTTGTVNYEGVSKKALIGGMVKLHYDPNAWWTIFADVFAVALLLIVITGFTMIPTKKLVSPKVIVPTILGIIIPIVFLFFL